ncbi:MAG: glycosyltransferase family 4 protein [Rhizobiaceae bacterium]
MFVDPSSVDVIAPNFKKRLSGVTSTIIQLVPSQREAGLNIAALGPGLPDHLPKIRFRDLWKLWSRPASGRVRVWHARRNVEMLPGIIMRSILRMPLKLVFTSASQRKHKAYTRFLIARMDAVIATSAKTAAYLKVPNTVIMHGIDTARFCPLAGKASAKHAVGLPSDTKIVGCFGRIRHQKGTDIFVDTMIALLPKNPGWMAIIAGRTTVEHAAFEKDLHERITAAGLTERIKFVGEHTDIERWYQALDLFIAPQRWEGFGLTPLEAMATGVPVIATDVGAFSELILEGVTGHVVQAPHVENFTKIADGLMTDRSMLDAYAHGAREHTVSNFSLGGEAKAIMDVYNRIWNEVNE